MAEWDEVMASIPTWRMYCIEQLVLCKDIPGDIVECGIAGGHNVINLATVVRDLKLNKKVYACDTFAGLPYKEGPALRKGNFYRITQDQLQLEANNRKLGKIIVPIVGLVEETLEQKLGESVFSFVWLDLDLYKPTLYSFKFFEQKMSIGGVIGFHDYLQAKTPGIAKVIQEEVNAKQYTIIYSGYKSIFYKKIN